MKRLRFKKLDAFAQAGSSGNPAGAVYLEAGQSLDEPQMLQLARELRGFVSEVAYLTPLDGAEADFRLRYFSAEREVPFCGHATIAAMHDLFTTSAGLRGRDRARIETPMGRLEVEHRPAVDAVFIAAPAPRFLDGAPGPAEIAEALGVTPECLDRRAAPALVEAGLKALIVRIADLSSLLDLAPSEPRLRGFCEASGVEVILVHCAEVAFAANAWRTRVFVPVFGYLEDPATGSASAAFGYHLLRTGDWDGSAISLEQGPSRETPNLVRLTSRPDPQLGRRVVFGGGAIARIEGEYLLVAG